MGDGAQRGVLYDDPEVDLHHWFRRTGLYEPGNGYFEKPEPKTSERAYQHRAALIGKLKRERQALADADDVYGMIQKDKQIDRVFAAVEDSEKLSSMV